MGFIPFLYNIIRCKVFALSTNAKTFHFMVKKVLKSFGVLENSRTFASAFAQMLGVGIQEKSSLKDLHRQRRQVVQEVVHII